MKCFETELAEVLLFEPQVWGDERGFFMETFRQTEFDRLLQERGLSSGIFVQENQSRSQKMCFEDYIISSNFHRVN